MMHNLQHSGEQILMDDKQIYEISSQNLDQSYNAKKPSFSVIELPNKFQNLKNTQSDIEGTKNFKQEIKNLINNCFEQKSFPVNFENGFTSLQFHKDIQKQQVSEKNHDLVIQEPMGSQRIRQSIFFSK